MTSEIEDAVARVNDVPPKCGVCAFPIHPQESGVRHFGFYIAHSEGRCVDLLRSALTASQAEVERLTRERDVALSASEWNLRDLQELQGRFEYLVQHQSRIDRGYNDQVTRTKAAEVRATRAEGLLAEAGEWERRCANVEAVLSSLSKAAWRVVNARDAFRSPDRTNHPNLVLEEAEAWIALREALDGKLPRAFLDKLKEQGQ